MKIFASNNREVAGGYFGFRIIKNDTIFYNSREIKHPINDEKIKDMCYLKDTLWILTTTGIYNFYDNKITKQHWNKLILTEVKELDNFKDSVLVICTRNNGVFIKSEQNHWRQISQKNGLNSSICFSLFCSDSLIYVGTNNGLNILKLSGNNITIQYVDKTNHLNSNVVLDIALQNKKLVLASYKGVDVVENYNKPIQFNSTFIFPIKVNDKEYYSSTNTYEFSSSQNDIQISYITPFYGENHQIRYRYKLNESDTSWKITNNTTIQFPNLNHGEYQFIVQPFYNSTFGEQKYVRITIHPFFTQTWWFRGSLFLMLMGMIYAIYRNKLSKKELEKDMILSKQKALISQMNPHFIFNSLNSIQNFILKNQQDLSVIYLSRFSKLIRRILDNSDKIFVTIDHDVETLTHYVELEKARFKNKFEYSINIDSSLDSNAYLIPPLLLQPFVENSIWHGLMHKNTPGRIVITYKLNKDKLVCIVEDDGVGRKKATEFKKEKTYQSKGIQITKERILILARANKFDIKFDVVDLVGKDNIPCGTKVEFNIPLICKY